MNRSNTKIDEIIQQALILRNKGKTFSEIFNSFPEHRNELSDFFLTADISSNEINMISPPKGLSKGIITNSNKKNTTESIRKISDIKKDRNIKSMVLDNNNQSAFNSINKFRALLFSKFLNFRQPNMNKKLLSGISIILLLLIIGSGLIIIKKRGAPVGPNVNRFALEDEIDTETNSFDLDIEDLNELESDAIIEDISSDLSEINSDIRSSLPPDIASLEAMEKELAYELDIFISDLGDSAGIENDTSLNSLSSQVGGISS